MLRLPTSPTVVAAAGFTLVELLLVLGVVSILGGLAFSGYDRLRARARAAKTDTLVHAVSAALKAYGQPVLRVPGAGLRYRWDFNQDGWLDGDPQRDDRFAAADRAAAVAAGHLGPVATLGLGAGLDLDHAGRVCDAWGHELRIDHDAERYAPDGFRLWSPGPDGRSATEERAEGLPAGTCTADDIDNRSLAR